MRSLCVSFSAVWCLLLVFVCCRLVVATNESNTRVSVRRHRPQTQVRLINILPHNASAFTEGLFFHNGSLLESTGLSQKSFIREYDLPVTGRSINVREQVAATVLNEFRFPEEIFGEGIATIGDKLYALTYKHKKIFVLRRSDFALLDSFPFDTSTGEGWGMTTDGKFLIVSDGSPMIHFYDPDNHFQLVRSIEVRHHDKLVFNVNELEYVDGEILANVWFENEVLRIDPSNGNVIEAIDFSWLPGMVTNLKTIEASSRRDAVMNGIAFNPNNRHVYLTGLTEKG